MDTEKDRLDQAFEFYANPVEPPPGLNGRIMGAVLRAERARRRRTVAIHSIAFALLSAFAFWSGGGVVQEMTRTGFVQIVSMLWTDSALALSNMGEWGMALIETLPINQLAWAGLLMYLAAVVGIRLLRDWRPRFPVGVV